MNGVNEKLEQAAKGWAYRTHATPLGQNISIEAFEAGADWQRKNIWHDVSELPNNGTEIVVIGKNDEVFSCTHVAGGKYRAYWDLYDLRDCKKWCYREDLLPV